MSNFDYSNLTTRELLEKAMNGEIPIPRNNPKFGESKYFFMKMGSDPYSSINDAETFDVPDDVDPFEFRDNGYSVPLTSSLDTPLTDSGDSWLDSSGMQNASQIPSYGLNKYYNSNNYFDSFQNNDPNCYMTFDGKNLNLYNNNGLVSSLDAQSGHNDYQSSIYQPIENKGPLPEGTYYANQDERQNIDLLDTGIGIGVKVLEFLTRKNIPYGSWKGGPISWGLRRVWLKPDENTNTYGRDGFTIHGGLNKGSAGCIDIPWQTDELSDYLDNCQFSVPVNVKYPKNW